MPRFSVIGSAETPGAYAEYVRCAPPTCSSFPRAGQASAKARWSNRCPWPGRRQSGALGPDTACLVMGAGPIGLGVLMWLKAKGVETVVVSEPSASRAETGPSGRSHPPW